MAQGEEDIGIDAIDPIWLHRCRAEFAYNSRDCSLFEISHNELWYEYLEGTVGASY